MSATCDLRNLKCGFDPGSKECERHGPAVRNGKPKPAVMRQGNDNDGATAAGRMLWLENLASVAARYPNDGSGERPGPCELTDEAIAGYEFSRLPGTPSAVIVLAAIKCFEYQSCEHDGWEKGEAKAFVDALRDDCIRVLTAGCDVWEITDRYVFEPGMRPKAVTRA